MENSTNAMARCITCDVPSFLCTQVRLRFSVANEPRMTLHLMVEWPISVNSLQIEGPVQVARRSDVDMNGHINNVTYLAWALETVPREVYYNYELEQVCQHTCS